MSNSYPDNVSLLDDGSLSHRSNVYYQNNHFGYLYSFYKSREKFYVFYSFFIFLFYSLGLIFGKYNSLLSDKPLLFVNNKFIFYFGIILVFLFGFTIFSKLINVLFLLYFGLFLGSFVQNLYFNTFSEYLSVGILALFSFFIMIFISECNYFSAVASKRGVCTIVRKELIYYFTILLIFISFAFISYYLFNIFISL